MEHLSDSMLLHAYEKAVELELHRDFIKMIEAEIMRRGLNKKLLANA